MTRPTIGSWRAALVAALVGACAPVSDEEKLRALLQLPDHFELPAIPEENPLTPEKIALGRLLFYDKRVSGNQTQSSGTCHVQARGFAEEHKTSTGSTGQVLTRNAQGLANAAYASTLTWANDGLTTFERQLQVPVRNDNPIELGVTDSVQDEVLARFDRDPDYADRFAEAFPKSDSGATVEKIIFAIASFVRTMVSGDSPYDRYLNGDTTALSESARRGMALFNGERLECFHCHRGTFLTTSYRDANTTPGTEQITFVNNGLYNVDGEGSYPPYDQGLYNVTLNPDDRGLFRPQSLRDVALTAPYMHDGSIPTLRDVVLHYAAGGRQITEGPLAGDGRLSPLKSGLVRGFAIEEDEINDVIAFLESLTGDDLIHSERFSDPWAE